MAQVRLRLGTLNEYIKQMRMFVEWCSREGASSTSLDAADGHIASIEDRSMHSARSAARALRAYGRYLVNDEQATKNNRGGVAYLIDNT